jgi:TonB family protein
MIADLMAGLLKANLAAAAGVLAVLLLRRAVRARFGARAAYGLWAAPIVAGIAVLLPHPARQAPPPVLLAPVEAVAEVFDATAAPVAVAPVRAGPNAAQIAFAVWLAGTLGAAGLLAFHQARFLASLGRVSREHGRLRRAGRPGVGPALVGVLRPWIVTPADFEDRFGEGERALILAHEETHLARGDAAANGLSCALQAACWFNPLAHVAARLARIDQELACDAAVIERFPAARRAYAELLLKTQIAAQPLPLGCHWPAHAAHPLKERIAMLKSPLPGRPLRAAGLFVSGALIAALGGLAWAAQPGQAGGAGAPGPAVGPGPAERAQAERDFAASPPEFRKLCRPRPDRTVSNDCTTITQSPWAALPTRADLMALYPAQARRDGVEAYIALNCDFADSGKVGECGVIDVGAVGRDGKKLADPSAYGFDRAALAATRYMAAQPKPGDRRLWNFWLGFSEKTNGGLYIANPPVPREKLVAPPPPGSPVARPVWVQKPTAADIARAYPAAAAKAHDRGYATIACKFSPAGRLRDCKVVNEPSAGSWFGAAALKLADSFQAKTVDANGDQVGGGTVLIPIYFQPPGVTPASNAPPAPAAQLTPASFAPTMAAAGPGAAERAEALRQLAAHPTYTCDPELERRGVGCKIIAQSVWLAVPTAAEVQQAYPAPARAAGESARIQVTCKTTTRGMLEGCIVTEVRIRGPNGALGTPASREDFRKAALQLARCYQLREPSPPEPAREGVSMFSIVFGDMSADIPVSLPGPRGGLALPVRSEAPKLIPASQPVTAPSAPRILKPRWVYMPSAADLARFYPPEAVKQHFEGVTVLSCAVDLDGKLSGCDARGPTGFGKPDAMNEAFRQATLSLAPLFRMQPELVDGIEKGGGRVNIPIRWVLPTDPAAKAALDGLRDPGPTPR